jgi:sucrose-6F-phosphate phosphohydrolase
MQFLLITDLDNTLVGDDRATFTLNQKLAVVRHYCYLIYATGRSYASALYLAQTQQLMEPDYWITGVGTEIYERGQLDRSWASQLSAGWHRDAIAKIAQTNAALILQPQSEQNPWKISFCLAQPGNSSIIDDLHSQLKQAGMNYQIVFSSGRDVDILPGNADKGAAASYLRKRLHVTELSTLACGDSGNDISLFQQSTLGTIVRNAQPELLKWYETHKPPHCYLARSPYAWGMLEGLQYFNLLPR